MGGGGRVPLNTGVNPMPVGADPRSGNDRGFVLPPGGPAPTRTELLLEAVLEELRAVKQNLTQAHLAPPRSDFLSKIPPQSVVAFFRLLMAEYTNTAGTSREVGRITMPQGTALVITSLKPVYFDASVNQIAIISNEYAMCGVSGAVANRFIMDISGTGIGDFGVQHNTLGFSSPGLSIQAEIGALMGWQGTGFYSAIIRGGRTMRITSETVTVIPAGNTIPDQIGMQIGGIKVPETILDQVIGGMG